jgi:hypothetical protein
MTGAAGSAGPIRELLLLREINGLSCGNWRRDGHAHRNGHLLCARPRAFRGALHDQLNERSLKGH